MSSRSTPRHASARGGGGGGGGGSGQPAELTPAEREAQVIELLEKLKAAAKAPGQAAQRIRELDKMIKNMRKARANCQAQLDEDRALVEGLNKQEERVLERLNPVLERLSGREEDAERIRSNLGMASQQFHGMISSTTDRITKWRVGDAHQRKRMVSDSLKVQRGYTMDAKAKMHKQVPASMRFKQKALARAGKSILSQSAEASGTAPARMPSGPDV